MTKNNLRIMCKPYAYLQTMSITHLKFYNNWHETVGVAHTKYPLDTLDRNGQTPKQYAPSASLKLGHKNKGGSYTCIFMYIAQLGMSLKTVTFC